MGLDERMSEAGSRFGEREALQAEPLEVAATHARSLHAKVRQALDHFHAAATAAGSGHLVITLSEPSLDAKHIRAFQFEIARGRTRAIVTAKSRGDVTLVGPFDHGKPEKPCYSLSLDEEEQIEEALGDLLEAFFDKAMRT